WRYHIGGVRVTRRMAMTYGQNTTAVLYTVENQSEAPCKLTVEPFVKFGPKEQAIQAEPALTYSAGKVSCGAHTLHIATNGTLRETPKRTQRLSYREDAKDGRPGQGVVSSICTAEITVGAGENMEFSVIFSARRQFLTAEEILTTQLRHQGELESRAGFRDPVARQLTVSADAFVVRRASTNGMTILAGYPLFSDWGRDTMIALTGCALVTGRFVDAASILRTFLAYEKDGLVPNLFPEGGHDPVYNTVDAALLLIDSVWQFVRRSGNWDFVREAYPTLERIIAAYRKGTHHAIYMDTDGLIHAGEGLDQVTWMDVCVQGILPTPRHGKPVEINAYWYNALKIMEEFALRLGLDGKDYGQLAEKVKASFVEKFYMEDKGYLRDVLSGTSADEQLRCNQIWALSLPYTMLSHEQECNVLHAVERNLYTPCGLRTLAPSDKEFKATYGGDQVTRDMAYHQGSVWVFPLGAFYLAYLKVRGNSPEAKADVRAQLSALEPMLREGCVGQLPELYDGLCPSTGKGCFAQAWSVGE
ncbi:MAG: amylo-alpha-1,6-glucosidase, partial [Oscillospiraceae bacterium]